jgi:hypothetical protein
MIERAAGEIFRSVGMDEIADDKPPSIAELAIFQSDGRAWVVVDQEEIDTAEMTPGLLRICEAESARGLARWPRVAMRRRLSDSTYDPIASQ